MRATSNKHLLVALFCTGLMFSAAVTAFSAVTGPAPRLWNFDQRLSIATGPATLSKEGNQAAALLEARVKGAKIVLNEVLGTPGSVYSTERLLSGPNGRGGAISDEMARAIPATDSDRAVKAFLNEYSALFGHGAEVLDAAWIKRDATDDYGVRKVVWQQQVDGIPVSDAFLIANTTKNGELVNVGSGFVPNVLNAADRGVPNRMAIQAAPPVPVREAVANAATNIGEELSAEEVTPVEESAEGAPQRQSFTAEPLVGKAQAQLVWLPMSRSVLTLCWEVMLTGRSRGELFRILVDALSGEVLLRHNLTYYVSNDPATYVIFDCDSPTPMSPGWSTPQSTFPPVVERSWLTLKYLYGTASPDGWIPDEAPPDLPYLNNTTSGNNVSAGCSWPGCLWLEGDPHRVFNFPLGLDSSGDMLVPDPTQDWEAGVTNAFYWCNWLHDKLYIYGFNEAEGNYQDDNFGRGGVENDPMCVGTRSPYQPSSAAMYYYPTDGSSPYMSIGLCDGELPDGYMGTPCRDIALDAEILIHEYVHAMSNRVAGDGAGFSYIQSLALSEGWSDFLGLTMLSYPHGDNVNGYGGCYAFGAYQAGGIDICDPAYYWGLRRFPYSTDMSKNPLTFKDIDTDQYSPPPGIPRNTHWDEAGPPHECHNAGEVWCSALWEARAKLIQRLGDDNNRQIIQFVMSGLRLLTTSNPTFLEARDAILLSDTLYRGGAYHQELWEAFAKRGMGYSATCPPAYTAAGVVEAFDLPPLNNQVATPTFSPVGGCYTSVQHVTISCATSGATIRYTTNSTDPTESSPIYSGPVQIDDKHPQG